LTSNLMRGTEKISQTTCMPYWNLSVHNRVSRIKRPWTYINDSEDKFLTYSFVYNFEQFFQQFIVRSVISGKLVDRCPIVHDPNSVLFSMTTSLVLSLVNENQVDSLSNSSHVLCTKAERYGKGFASMS